MAREDWYDPRLTVFIIWGIFVVLFIIIPSRRVVKRLFHLLGCRCCAYEEEAVPSTSGNGRVTSYEGLSSARKGEIDSLRASHLTYRLHPFSMTLKEEHMLRLPSSLVAESLATEHSQSSVTQDRTISDTQSSGNGDVETGLVRDSMDPSVSDEGEEIKEEEENKEEEDAKYTHVSIPQPGHNADCVDVDEMMARAEADKKEAEKKPKEERKSRLRLFGGKPHKEEAKESNGDKEDVKTLDDTEGKKGRRRACPIFCAVCLMEYEPSERISWSSNKECTHVFHEDCVVQWLVSLGRTKAKRQRFTDDPTEAQLLNYELECPCCRQEFISRGQAELPEVCGEERV